MSGCVKAVQNCSQRAAWTPEGEEVAQTTYSALPVRMLSECATGRWIFAATIQELRAAGCESLRAIAAALGGKWSAVQVAPTTGSGPGKPLTRYSAI